MDKSPPGNSEFYAGDINEIGRACRAGKWSELREGKFSVAHVIFPDCVYILDILLLSEVVADVTGSPAVIWDKPGKIIAGDQELWAAEIAPKNWVNSIACINENQVPALQKRWMEIHVREYEPEPELIVDEWMNTEMLQACYSFVNVARITIDRSIELVEIWMQ